MQTPEIVREVNRVKLERIFRESFLQKIHDSTLSVLRKHGDEVVAGAKDDYIIRDLHLDFHGVIVAVDLSSETGQATPSVAVGFKSELFNRLLLVADQSSAIADCTLDEFDKTRHLKSSKKRGGYRAIALRKSTLKDLRQFKELMEAVSIASSERKAQSDLTLKHGRVTLEGLEDGLRYVQSISRLSRRLERARKRTA